MKQSKWDRLKKRLMEVEKCSPYAIKKVKYCEHFEELIGAICPDEFGFTSGFCSGVCGPCWEEVIDTHKLTKKPKKKKAKGYPRGL